MKEFPDDELDKLFRKSAEELDSNFDPQDWNALKNRLDENDGRTLAAWFKKWWPAGMLALLMLGGVTTYLLTAKDEISESIVNKKNQYSLAEKADRPISNEQSADGSSISKKAESDFVESGRDKDVINTEKKTAGAVSDIENRITKKADNTSELVKAGKIKEPDEELFEIPAKYKNNNSKSENRKTLPRRWSETGGVYLVPNHSIGRRGGGATLSENGVSQKSVDFEKADVERIKSEKLNPENLNRTGSDSKGNGKDSFLIVDTDKKNIEKTAFGDELTRFDISASELKSRSLVWKKSNSLPEIEVKKAEIPFVSEPVKAVGEQESTPKFAVRFSYSPDISSVGLKNFTKPGTAVSLLVEYAILPKLYIQTGVARSSKVYKAEGGDYEWPSSWNDQTVRPNSTNATCKVLEIPLNLRYDIHSSGRAQWFAGAGASSYYMQNEKYDYNYKPYTHGIKWNDWEGSTGWYLFSHINASVGYEYHLSTKLSLLAEPYVKIPVKKVGFGKVDLFTTGVWLSIRYTPLFKK